MKRTILGMLVVLFLAACMSQVRYSPAELNQFSPKIQEHIKKSEIALGMSQAAVRLSWGAPSEVRVLEPDDQGNYREEWIYPRFVLFAKKLIFTDGKLTGIIDGKRKRFFTPTKESSGEETQEMQEMEKAGEEK